MYENSEASTIPGTDTKVTPEMDVPTIEMATIHHGDFLPPSKKSFPRASFLRPAVSALTMNRITKYPSITASTVPVFIIQKKRTKILIFPLIANRGTVFAE
jgi:hypothetical protein